MEQQARSWAQLPLPKNPDPSSDPHGVQALKRLQTEKWAAWGLVPSARAALTVTVWLLSALFPPASAGSHVRHLAPRSRQPSGADTVV